MSCNELMQNTVTNTIDLCIIEKESVVTNQWLSFNRRYISYIFVGIFMKNVPPYIIALSQYTHKVNLYLSVSLFKLQFHFIMPGVVWPGNHAPNLENQDLFVLVWNWERNYSSNYLPLLFTLAFSVNVKTIEANIHRKYSSLLLSLYKR